MKRRLLTVLLAFALCLFGGAAASPAPPTLTWHPSRPMPRPAGGLAAATDNGYVFIDGGYNGAYQWAGYSAQVTASDPGLNGWRHIAALPVPLYSHTMVSALGSLYVLGGTTNGRDTGAQDTVYRTRLLPGGHTGSWVRAGALPYRVYGHSTVIDRTHMYVAGGYVPNQGYSPAVFSVALGPHGLVGRWRRLTPLPQPRFGATLVAGRGYLFAVGGMTQEQVVATVYAAPLQDGGRIGPWHAVQALPTSLAHAGATVAAGWLVVAGGSTGLNLTSSVTTVLASPIQPRGTLGPWQYLAPLKDAAAAPILLSVDKYLYVFGGFNGTVYNASVYRACPSFVLACSSGAAATRPSATPAKRKK